MDMRKLSTRYCNRLDIRLSMPLNFTSDILCYENCGGDQSLLGGEESFRHWFRPSEQLWQTFQGGSEQFSDVGQETSIKVYHT